VPKTVGATKDGFSGTLWHGHASKNASMKYMVFKFCCQVPEHNGGNMCFLVQATTQRLRTEILAALSKLEEQAVHVSSCRIRLDALEADVVLEADLTSQP